MSGPVNKGLFASAARRVPARKKPPRYPLHLTILRFAFVLVLFTAAGIGLPTYWNTRSAVNDLSNKLVQEIAQQTEFKAEAFLGQAKPTLELCRQRLQDNPRFGTGPNRAPLAGEWKARARFFLHIMQADPDRYDRIFFGDATGDFTSAFMDSEQRWAVDHRWITEDSAHQPVYHREVFLISASDQWTAVPAEVTSFDPRRRPWYQAAGEKRRQVWTEPYLFAASRQPGITVALPVQDSQKRLLGVCGIDFQLHDLDTFVSRLHPGDAGKVFIFAGPSGESGVVAQPGRAADSVSSDTTAATLRLPPAAESHDLVVQAAAKWLAAHPASARKAATLADTEFRVEGTRYLGATYPFTLDSDLHWTTVIVIPEEQILGPLWLNNWITLSCCFAAIILAGLFGYFYSLQVSRPLRAFAAEMKRVRNLELSEEPSPPSSIDEVHEMGVSLDTMKVGLRAFEKYVPTDLVRMLLQSGEDPVLGGKSAPLTVMFGDIVGFSTISEQMPPQLLVDALAEYLEEMEKIVWEHDGIVDKYIGDAVMALWGAPIRPREEAIRSACHAALECQQRLSALQREREASGQPCFVFNIGIHTGEAVVGNIGSLRRFNYTAIGDTVNLTSRLEGLNRIYGTKILISQSTYQAVQEEFDVRLIDYVAVKGRKTPLMIYELLAKRGMLDESLRPVLEAYAEGLKRYQARDWQGALEKFTEASRATPDPDPPSLLFMARCREYLISPPPADWDGVYVYTKK